MKKLKDWIYTRAGIRNLILAVMAIIPFNALAFPLLTGRFRELTGGMQTLDVQFGYLPAEALAQMSQYSEAAHRQYLLIELTADLLFPLVYALLFSLLLALIFKTCLSESHPFRSLALLPFFMMVADYAENFTIILMLAAYPALAAAPAAWIAAGASFLKWIFGGLSILGLLTGLGYLIARLIRGDPLERGV